MTGNIYIEGEIGERTTAETVRAQKNNDIYDEYHVHFNTIGGDVYVGYQIGSELLNLGKPTTAIIEGVCASIGTYVACCCDKIIMMPHSEFMIHDPTCGIQGRAEDLRAAAGQLDRIKSDIISRYMTKVSRKGVTREQLSAMMAAETSMSATKTQEIGFADEVMDRIKAVAKLDISKMKLKEEDKKLFDHIESLFKDFSNTLSRMFRPKNALTVTLDSGQVIVVDAQSEDWTGAKVAMEDGTPLPAGQYTTVDGISFMVDESSTITQMMEAPTDNNMETTDKLKKEVEDLKAQLAAKDESIKALEAKAKEEAEFKNKISSEFDKIKKEYTDLTKKAFGDDTPPKRKPINQDSDDDGTTVTDPMAELGNAWLSSHRY